MVLMVSLLTMATAYGDVIWDFENGNDHGFSLWSVKYATAAPDDPNTAGDESLTGVGGADGLPDAGVAWSIGRPDQYDGQKPAVNEGDKVKADGTMEYNQPDKNHPFTFPVNSRGQESYLNTYNLTQWGDNLHTQENDQIATSPVVTLGENAVLTVWSQGGGSGTHAPEFDPNPDDFYSDGSSGIAVISATDFSFLASVYTQNQGTLGENTLDLSAFAGQKVLIEVVDAFEGSWGWFAVDEIQITNATVKNAGLIVQMTDGVMDWGFDEAMKERLETLGYNVRVVDGQNEISDGDFTIDDANALDLLVISESISSSRSDPLIGTTTPTMHQEAYGWDNHNLAGAAVATNWYEGTDVDIVNDSHPIIVDANLSMGPMKFFDPSNSWTAESVNNLAPGAEVLAQINVGGDDLAIVFAIEKGTELANGDPAASRIVGFSLPGLGTDNGGPFGPEAMTDEAWAFFDAAIRWLDAPIPPAAAMIVEPEDMSSGFDQAQYDRLVSMGYEVTIVPQSDVGSAFTITDAERFDLLLVSESISSSGADPLIGANVPMMHNESYGWDNHGFIIPELKGATWVVGSSIDVVNDAHPIAVDAGLSAGPLQFYSTEASWTADLVSALAPGAELIAQTTVVDGNNVTDYALIFAIEQGAELAGGATAANRIVGFSIPADQPYDASVMTEEAWALWEAAIKWLVSPPEPPTGPMINWDFENGNDHGFTLWSIAPAIPAPDDTNTAGDEALTGGWEEGNPNNLPEAGMAWTIGPPTMMDGLLPGADPANARVDENGLLNYSLGTSRMTADHGFLNTFNLNLHGDFVHTQANDQIATSPVVQLYEGAILTATVAGSGADHEPILDEPGKGYTDGSGGIAVLSAEDGTLLVSMTTEGRGGEDDFILDLSAFAGQKVVIEVVDAHEGGWGWMAVDKIVITNAQ
jgi:hypothetical protein